MNALIHQILSQRQSRRLRGPLPDGTWRTLLDLDRLAGRRLPGRAGAPDRQHADQRSKARGSRARAPQAVLDAITYAATRIIGAADWRPAMPELLSRLGTATDVSRVFMFEIHPAPGGEGLAQSCRFSWSAPGFPSLSGDPRFQNDPIPTTSDVAVRRLVPASAFARRGHSGEPLGNRWRGPEVVRGNQHLFHAFGSYSGRMEACGVLSDSTTAVPSGSGMRWKSIC